MMMDLVSDRMSASTVSLLGNGEFDSLALRQRDPWLLRTNDKNVILTGGKRVIYGVLDVDDIESTIVTLSMCDDPNTAHVAATGDHSDCTSIELHKIGNFASGEVNLDGVVDFDGRVRETDGSSIMRNQEWDPALAQLNALDLSKLVLCLLSLNTVNGEATLGVVDETEVLISLVDGDDIHETSWVGYVSADLAVDLDQTLHDDGLGLASVEGVL